MGHELPAPRWLEEEGWLRALLNWFVDRLDAPRTKAITRRVNAKTIPALYRFDGDAEYRWKLVETLESEYALFEIRYAPVGRASALYENAQLRLNESAEPMLRDWLSRPSVDPCRVAWQQAVSRYSGSFIDGGLSLLNLSPGDLSYSPEELALAFFEVSKYLDVSMSMREISARCFRGDSKFLDSRADLLIRLYGERAAAIRPRPLLLTAFAPRAFETLLFVENQDSFLRLVDRKPQRTAVLYSGGFRAGAARLSSSHTRFAFLPGSDGCHFDERWRGQDFSSLFWGDLDFAGMGILTLLRRSLPALRAWERGYAPMVSDLAAGRGHAPAEAAKGMQIAPVATGCPYADRVLLPAMRQFPRFIDQEAYAPDIE
jgi:hypothetical protein